MTRRKSQPAGKFSATFLHCSVKHLVLFVFRCRSIIHEECGHGKRMLITFELSVVLWKKIWTKCIDVHERLRVILEIKFFYIHYKELLLSPADVQPQLSKYLHVPFWDWSMTKIRPSVNSRRCSLRAAHREIEQVLGWFCLLGLTM